MSTSQDAIDATCADDNPTTASTPGTADAAIPIFPDAYGSIPGESHLNRARDDSFLLVLDLPCFIKKLNMGEQEIEARYPLDKLEINVVKANIPDISAPSKSVPFGSGGTLKIPGSRIDEYSPLDVQFVIDSRYRNYNLLHKWIGKLPDLGDGGLNALPTPNHIFATFAIYALDEYKRPVVRFLFKDAFPTRLGGFDLNTRNEGNDILGTVTFDYSIFEVKLLDPDATTLIG